MNPKILEYTIRLDCCYDELKADIDKVLEKADAKGEFVRYIISRETKNKNHYQGVVWTELGQTAYRSRWEPIYKKLRKYGHNHFSGVPVTNPDSYYSYIVKECMPVIVKGFTDDEINAYKSKSYIPNKDPKKKKSSSTFKKISEWIKSDEAIRELEESWYSILDPRFDEENSDSMEQMMTNPRCLIYIISEWYMRNDRVLPSDFQLENMAKTLKAKHIYNDNKGDYRRYMKERISMMLGATRKW